MRAKFLIIFSFLSACSTAQDFSTRSKKAIQYYNQTEYMLVRREYFQAIELLNQALDKDDEFIEAHIRIGTCYRGLNNNEEALYHYKRAVELEPDNPKYKSAYLFLGNLYFVEGKYTEAIKFLDQFLSYKPVSKKYKLDVEKTLINARFAQKKIKEPLPFKPRALPAPLNALSLQYFPVLTADQNSLVFTGRKGYGALDDEDIYVSHRDKEGKWSAPRSLSPYINSKENEGTCAISADGRTMIFTSCRGRKGYGSCDLYITYRTGSLWSEPVNMGPNVNSKSWDSQPSLSADGRTLFFVSNRIGGYGLRDIWATNLGLDSIWTKPKNMGGTINTGEDEVSPTIHANGSVMYFASKGFPGFGGLDIYQTEFDGISWSEPENLGYPLNTSDDQLSLFISADGQTGYYSNEKKLRSEYYSYLFEFDVPEEIRIEKRSNYIYGVVRDAKTKEPLLAGIQLFDLAADSLVSLVTSDSQTGSYTTVLTEGSDYVLYVESKGYLFRSLSFTDSSRTNKQPVQLDIELNSIDHGVKTVLNNIFFDFDDHELLPESQTELKRVTSFLMVNETLEVEIAGHTDNAGDALYNKKLSERRAKSVFEFLVRMGIGEERLRFKGYGESQPRAGNDSESNRRQNRRIEFLLR